MTNASTTEVKADIGLTFTYLDGTTTARNTIVTAQITKAQRDTKALSGTTTGLSQDIIIRNLADYYVILNAMSNLDPNESNFEAFSRMSDNFYKEAERASRFIGKSLDGMRIKFSVVNQ